ncbi:transporter substrate-binding domain-containing protein [Pseudohoeflea suaedae]|uniref:Transporter substrate-binding domain-containing protein n=1 Tax=Pseudohoeflea suaedae TaxID=877384 RepID=A0A4R5PN06_9HYPH|nr:ABC transporter substrate-binding protein [Pseudohoeflea suaedae]TDH38420.1 transporter substrate-binding domain-containing protein [Pseudohoeflea suaedae]
MNLKNLAAAALFAAGSALASLGVPHAAFAETTKLKVGYLPVGVYSYFWRAQDAGYFADENLEVELVPMAGGGQIIPALQSGALQFGISDALGVLNARKGGLPVTYVSFNFSQSSDNPVHAVLTTNPDIKSPKDLEGKAVATNLSYNTDWTMMREWLRKNDVDIDKVTFREIPFPDMLPALRNDTVAAVGAVEPFVTFGKEQGANVLGHYFTDVKSPVVLSGIVAMLPYVEENPDIVKGFVKAVNRAIEDFKADPAVARETIGAHTKIPATAIEAMNLGDWETEVPPSEMQFWVDAAEKEGILNETDDLNSLVWSPKE